MEEVTFTKGVTRDLVLHIGESKGEPQWMKDKRLNAFSLFEKSPLPSWGPDISKLNLDEIVFYIDPEIEQKTIWEELPKEILETFDKLGIPKAEQEYLGGVGAQYDSHGVYHKLKESLVEQGVIFEDMDTAMKKYPDLLQEYFMTTCVPVEDHTFTKLHGAVWSGGTFIYVPKGVKVQEPLQAYFRMNRSASGQFEHTLLVADEGSEVTYIEGCSAPRYNASSLHVGCVEIFARERSKVTYISVENWSKNVYNLNTKRALVEKNAHMRWVSGNMGSGVTMLYPTSVLRGEHATSENVSVVFAGRGQVQDTGAKAIHLAPHTTSTIHSKSISKDGGVSNYRGLVSVSRGAHGSKASLVCDSLLLDNESEANSFPVVKNKQDDVEISHEATIGSIGEEELFYLESRGIEKDEAIRIILSGFVEPVVKALPMEYAVEFNRLIELEIEGH